jgi:hypothetical protein
MRLFIYPSEYIPDHVHQVVLRPRFMPPVDQRVTRAALTHRVCSRPSTYTRLVDTLCKV